MTAVLGGFGAAICFAVSTLCSSRTSRMIGPTSALAWVALVGFAIAAPTVALGGTPASLDLESLAWLVASGAGNTSGLLLTYAALRRGQVGVVAPIVSTEGAVAAVLALASGERITLPAGAFLVVIAAGVLLAGLARGDGGAAAPGSAQAISPAIGAALAFGVGLYATARVGRQLPLAWALLPSRLIGVIAVAAPLAASHRLRLTRRAAPLVFLAGLGEAGGFASFTLGARDDIAVSAVLASLFAGLATLAAYFLFRERLDRTQRVGVIAIAIGVAALSALQA